MSAVVIPLPVRAAAPAPTPGPDDPTTPAGGVVALPIRRFTSPSRWQQHRLPARAAA
jgi:hypothetical protein